MHFPFSAIVGQNAMKKALLLHAVDASIGGVLVRGEKGTAKSTLVRSLAALLPGSNQRVVDLPLNTTPDRLVGALDIDAALSQGQFRFRPGILSEAHDQWLYVDEVNLLDDTLVDLILDAAALGENILERDGMSMRHPCKFVLVGSMNPEEGELRPQLLDRFALVVDVQCEAAVADRVEILRRRLQFDANPQAFQQQWEEAENTLRTTIAKARALHARVQIDDFCLRLAAHIGVAMQVDGHRADLAFVRAAKAVAALEGRIAVEPSHLLDLAPIVLPHRMHRKKWNPADFAPNTWAQWIAASATY